MEIHGVSASFLMDLEQKSRSFQNKNMSYKEVLQTVFQDTDGAAFMDSCSKGKTIERPYVQYQETDWDFIRRLASHFHQGILPDILFDKPKIFFGNKQGASIGKLEDYNYYLEKNFRTYAKSKNNTVKDISEQDAIVYKIETLHDYNMGDKVTYQNTALVIRGKEMEMCNGTVLFRYDLVPEKGYWKDYQFNEHIVGVSIQGTVLDRINEKLKVKLEIDDKQDKGTAWMFPYTTYYAAEGYSGWYCMPEIGDTVNIYFPTNDEVNAVGIECTRMKPSGADKITDPKVKYFRTIDGKELMFSPEEIRVTCILANGKKVQMKLHESEGIELYSTEPIQFHSDKTITMQADGDINITADEIRMIGKAGEIAMKNRIEINGSDVRIN